MDYTIGVPVAARESARDLLKYAEHHKLAQTNHEVLRDQVLCSHIRIRTEEDTRAAGFQLSTWCAAGFQKQENVWAQRHRTWSAVSVPVPSPAPVPLWRRRGADVKLWLAVMDSGNAEVHILDVKNLFIDEADPDSLRKVIDTLARVMTWAQSYYLLWFRRFLGVPDLNGEST